MLIVFGKLSLTHVQQAGGGGGEPVLEEINFEGDAEIPEYVNDTVTEVTGNVDFLDCSALVTFSTPNLATVGGYVRFDNAEPVTVFNLSSLRTVGGYISLFGLPTTDPADFSALETVGEYINCDHTDFPSADFSSLKSVGGTVGFFSGKLDQESVDAILIKLASLDGTGDTTSWDNKTVDLSGGTNVGPSAAGLVAKATLEGRGNTVMVNDTTAPILSDATGTETGATTADLSVSTDEANGRYWVVVTQSGTAPTKAQVNQGENHLGDPADFFSDEVMVVATGPQDVFGATGLTAETEYWVHFMHEDAATNQSDVATSSSFETDAAAPLTAVGPFTLGSLTSGWNGWTIVARIPSSAISNTGHAQTRVTFRGAPSGAENAQVSMAYIGMMAAAADGFDFATTPVQLLVGGLGTFTVPQGTDLVTDFVTFEIEAGGDLLIAVSFNSASHDNFGFESEGGFFNYSRNIAGDAATVDKSTYSTAANQIAFVKQVEVIG